MIKDSVYLRDVRIFQGEAESYPFNLPLFEQDLHLSFERPVTIFYGDNGIGKSTILKGIAEASGFAERGGSKAHFVSDTATTFGKNIRLSWLPKVTSGFFFRADKLSDISDYLDGIAREVSNAVYSGLNGRSLDTQSHGEAVFALISKYTRTSKRNIVILDEPESALSVKSQIRLVDEIMRLSHENTQIIISTHSPVILATPNADIRHVTAHSVIAQSFERSEPYLLMRQVIKEGADFFGDGED